MAHGLLYYALEALKDKLKILPVNFAKPWWQVVTKQRFYLSIALISETVYAVFRPLAILSFGFIFASNNFENFLILFAVWAGVYTFSLAGRMCGQIVQLQTVHSVHYRAHQLFLQVDPIYHAHRSSGTILGKIDRASRAYEYFLEAVCLDFLQTIAGVSAVIVSFCYQSWKLALMTALFLAVIVFLNYVVSQFYIVPYEKRVVKADDKVRSVSVENLAQITLIRTCFASNESIGRLKGKDIKAMRKEGGLLFLYTFFYYLIRMLYLLSIGIISWYIFLAIRDGLMSTPVGLSFLMSYLRGTHEVVRIEKPMRNIIKSVTQIRDLFNYVKIFGKQSFPVLQPVAKACRDGLHQENVKELSIKMNGVSFNYPDNPKIFNNHSFNLSVNTDQKNKLYGIIGPSGIGKSTLIYLLGGQLQPPKGRIFINDVDIYQVDDIARRNILALQGQTSTNVRGTLRYNLLFALPRYDERFTDDHLIVLLKRVGLWALFEKKNGLNTFIGEAGLTLSGGQRQRLNFANLYLRAGFYKPALILIDEPTSSLDEVSEQAITEMVFELAHDAVTMVIAHRLNTVKEAVGLIDCSIMSEKNEITIQTHDSLVEKSAYYKQLVEGRISIEE